MVEYQTHITPPPPLGAWSRQAACLDADPASFFPEQGDTGADAKTICARCPVIEACLDYALTNRQHHGIWGGLSDIQRAQLHRRHLKRRQRAAGAA